MSTRPDRRRVVTVLGAFAVGACRPATRSAPTMSNEPRCEVQPVLFVACGSPLSALGRPEGEQAHPTPEHFLPLLHALGASSQSAAASFPIEGFDHSLSMRSVRFG